MLAHGAERLQADSEWKERERARETPVEKTTGAMGGRKDTPPGRARSKGRMKVKHTERGRRRHWNKLSLMKGRRTKGPRGTREKRSSDAQ